MSADIEEMRLAALKTLQAISENGLSDDIVRVNAAATLLHHTTPPAQPSQEQLRAVVDVMLQQADEHYAGKDKPGPAS